MTRSFGRKYEALASEYYKREGFEILERNYQAGRKEIDLIVRREDIVVFVEVKAVTNTSRGHPSERVGRNKRQNLIDAANHYLQSHRWESCDLRFDVVTFVGGKLEHYPGAFEAE